MSQASRCEIVGAEVVGLGAFLLLIMFLQMLESNWNQGVEQFAWVYAIVGATETLVGLEILSLNRKLPSQQRVKA